MVCGCMHVWVLKVGGVELVQYTNYLQQYLDIYE